MYVRMNASPIDLDVFVCGMCVIIKKTRGDTVTNTIEVSVRVCVCERQERTLYVLFCTSIILPTIFVHTYNSLFYFVAAIAIVVVGAAAASAAA